MRRAINIEKCSLAFLVSLGVYRIGFVEMRVLGGMDLVEKVKWRFCLWVSKRFEVRVEI